MVTYCRCVWSCYSIVESDRNKWWSMLNWCYVSEQVERYGVHKRPSIIVCGKTTVASHCIVFSIYIYQCLSSCTRSVTIVLVWPEWVIGVEVELWAQLMIEEIVLRVMTALAQLSLFDCIFQRFSRLKIQARDKNKMQPIERSSADIFD